MGSREGSGRARTRVLGAMAAAAALAAGAAAAGGAGTGADVALASVADVAAAGLTDSATWRGRLTGLDGSSSLSFCRTLAILLAPLACVAAIWDLTGLPKPW